MQSFNKSFVFGVFLKMFGCSLVVPKSLRLRCSQNLKIKILIWLVCKELQKNGRVHFLESNNWMHPIVEDKGMGS